MRSILVPVSPMHFILRVGSALAACQPIWTQGALHSNPGLPPDDQDAHGLADASQTDRFDARFNPALSFVVDSALDFVDSETGDDGFDSALRTLEFAGHA
jgi:hypothetical protein